MTPIIITLAVLTACCALTMVLSIAWGRRQLRSASALPVTLYADDPALGIRLDRAKRQRRERLRRRRTHPLRISHIRLDGRSLWQWTWLAMVAVAKGLAALSVGLLIGFIGWTVIAVLFAL